MGSEFEFEIGQGVQLAMSGEEGYVIGRAEYMESVPSYFVRYRAGDGRQVEAWWSGASLRKAAK